MGIDRIAGRGAKADRSFPTGCSGLNPDPIASCTSYRNGKVCRGCVREGAFPAPSRLPKNVPCMMITGPNVQIIRYRKQPMTWAIIVFVGGDVVNGRYPIVLCADRSEAIEIAHLRARQLRPHAALRPWSQDPNTWHCGDVMISLLDRAA